MSSDLYDLVVDCENQLGWSGPSGVAPWRARVTEVGKLRKALAAHPDISARDLRLAMAWCKRRQEPIKSTLELINKVDVAKRHTVTEHSSDLTITHRDAMGWEQAHPDSASERWLARLVRSFGPGRAEVLREWRAAGRGPVAS